MLDGFTNSLKKYNMTVTTNSYLYEINIINSVNVIFRKKVNHIERDPIFGRINHDYLEQINALHQKGLKNKTKFSSEDIQELGTYLYKTLFCSKFDSSITPEYDFISFRDEAVYESKAILKVELRIQKSPEFYDLPWEFIHVPKLDPISVDSNIAFYRWFSTENKLYPQPVENNKAAKILMITSSLADDDQIDGLYNKTCEEIKKYEDRYQLIKCLNTSQIESDETLESVIDKLMEQKPDIIHIIAHGKLVESEQTTKIIFKDNFGKSRYINSGKFAQLISRYNPKIVFFQSCETGAKPSETMVNSLIERNIPVIIAMQYEVENYKAKDFTSKFYSSLAEDGKIDKAVQEGRRYLLTEYGDTHAFATPVIFSRIPEGMLWKYVENRELPSDYKNAAEPVTNSGATTILPFNPFSVSDSNKEKYFDGYFIKPPIFDDLFKKESSIFFGEEGSGKSACRRIVEFHCVPKTIDGDFCITIMENDFEQFENKVKMGESFDIDRYVSEKLLSRLEECKIVFDDTLNKNKLNKFNGTIQHIVDLLKNSGLGSVFILVDIGYRGKKFNQLIIDYLYRLIRFFDQPYFIFKIFFSIELRTQIISNSMLENFNEFTIDWHHKNKEPLFKELIKRRFSSFSTLGYAAFPVENFGDVSGGKLSIKVEEKVIKKSRTPRELIEYCDQIISHVLPLIRKNGFIKDEVLNFLEERKEKSGYSALDYNAKSNDEGPIIKILHLSDIHLSKKKPNQHSSLKIGLIEDLKRFFVPKGFAPVDIDYLVITGDITDKADKNEYNMAKEFLKSLSDELKLDGKIIIVPGNHDMCWKTTEKAYIRFRYGESKDLKKAKYTCIRSGQDNEIYLKNEMQCCKKFNKFSQFYGCFNDTPYPSKYEEQVILLPFKEHKLLLTTINTSTEIDHVEKNKMSIPSDALNGFFDKMQKEEDTYKDWLKISVLHHPPSFFGDESELIKRLHSYGFRIFMHGHIHQNNSFHTSIPGGFKKTYTVGAGSFGQLSKEGKPFQYNILFYNCSKKELKVFTRKKESENGSWGPDRRWGKDERDDFYTIHLENQIDETQK